MKKTIALLLALVLIFSTTVSAVPLSEGAEIDLSGTEWYQDGYANGLYQNQAMSDTVGYRYQNETVENILKMSTDPTLLANGWSLDSFFEGTVFQGVTIEDLQLIYSEGTNDLGEMLGTSLFAFGGSYALECQASDQFKNFSMDLYDDVHGTLYQLKLGEHDVFCIDYGKHSPKGVTYEKGSTADYLTGGQQDVLKKLYLFWVWARNAEYGSLNWGTDTDFPDIENTSSFYLYMQICTWAAMKGCDFLACVDAVRDAINKWDPANSSWGDGYYKMAETFLNNKHYEKYTVDIAVYTSGKSANQNMLAFDAFRLAEGEAYVKKVSASTEIVEGNTDCYSLAGAEYGVYTKASDANKDTNRKATLVTKADGNTNTVKLTAGTYYVKEVKASKGYSLDTKVYTLNVEIGKTAYVTSVEKPVTDPSSIEITKMNAQIGAKALPLAGAQFEIKYYAGFYESVKTLPKNATRSWVIQTKGEEIGGTTIYYTSLDKKHLVSGDEFYYGETTIPTLPLGTITIEEIKAAPGYTLEGGYLKDNAGNKHEGIYLAQITKENSGVFLNGSNAAIVENFYIRGGVEIQKVDGETDEPFAQGDASLAGAKYGIYSLNDYAVPGDKGECKKGDLVTTIETDKNGVAATEDDTLAIGKYEIYEISASTGYLIDSTKQTFEIKAEGKMVELTTSFEEQIIRGGVAIQKLDSETLKDDAQGAATLAGAEYAIYNASKGMVLVDGVTYGEGEVIMVLVTDEKGAAMTAKNALPYGTYKIVEEKAPNGYLVSGVTEQTFMIREDGKMVELTGEKAFTDDIIRGDIKFVKKDAETGAAMAGVEFKITSKNTGESHNVITGEDGSYSSKLDDTLWFGTGTPDAEKGKFLYDSYIIEEIPGANNVGKKMFSGSFSISEEEIEIDLGTINNRSITIKTLASEKGTGSKLVPANTDVVIEDRVSYTALQEGVEYTMTGVLMSKLTGEALLDAEGNKITSTLTFTPEKEDGEVVLAYELNTAVLAGQDVVVFEYLYLGSEIVVSHEDINDPDQTIHIPEIGTTATDKETGDHITNADEEITIIDTVAYKNLIVGKEYILSGVLMDKETGNAILDDAGKEVTAKTSFTPEEASGEVDVIFTFSGVKLAGKTLVAFEELLQEERSFAVHADIEDEEQTVYIPEIGTLATAADGTKQVKISSTVTLKDTVSYKNLIPGKEYKVSGVLMDKTTGKALLDAAGKQITSEASFVADKADGTTQVTFTFDGSKLVKDMKLVVFERLFILENGVSVEVAVHEDINDEGQTVTVIAKDDGGGEDGGGDDDGDEPGGPGGGEDGGGDDEGVDTGDSTNIGLWIVLLSVSCFGIIALVHKKYKWN